MAVEACLRVEGALVGNLQLVDGIIIDFLCPFGVNYGSRQTAKREPHEDSVEPHLIGIDGLVPIDLVGLRTWLVLQLLHERLHGFEILRLRLLLVHAGDEVSRADIVEVVLKDIVALDVTIGINHRVSI